MDQKNNEKKQSIAARDRKDRIVGTILVSIFAILITSGIIAKRMYGKDAFTVIMFHLPAAVFLITGTMRLTAKNKRQHSNQAVPDVE